MAELKTLTLVSAEERSPGVRLLELESNAKPLGFEAGQFLILDSGVELADGRRVKRAYSIISNPGEQQRAQIMIKQVEGGLGSGSFHDAEVGSEFAFSGPWGKFKLLPEDPTGEILILVTDTGITAALGLLGGAVARERARDINLIWLAESDDYFLEPDFVRDNIPDGVRFQKLQLPVVGDESRYTLGTNIASAQAAPQLTFLAGDGGVVFPVASSLESKGLNPDFIRLECFFNNPNKK